MWEQTVWWTFVKDDDYDAVPEANALGLSVSRSRVASNAQSQSDSSTAKECMIRNEPYAHSHSDQSTAHSAVLAHVITLVLLRRLRITCTAFAWRYKH
jgi:hypothetical protein